jgi:hypothetical protein
LSLDIPDDKRPDWPPNDQHGDNLDNLVNRLNDLNDAFNIYVVRQHDKPDVEFNDDGSVRVNRPGNYFFDGHDFTWGFSVVAWRKRDDNNNEWHSRFVD